MPKKQMRDAPIAEITLRKYEKPNTKLSDWEFSKKICLMLGLLNPGDSRDGVVDVLHTLLYAKRALTSKQIIAKITDSRTKAKLSLVGLTHVNICRQLRKLKEMQIVEVKADKYKMMENESLKNLFSERIIPYYLNDITKRISLYLDELETRQEKNV